MGVSVYKNAHIELIEDNNVISMKILLAGYSIQLFNEEVAKGLPRLKITKFAALSAAFRDNIKGYIEIGEFCDVVQISVSSDAMVAQMSILLSEEAFDVYDKKKLLAFVVKACKEAGVIYGLTPENIVKDLRAIEPVDIAHGLLPIHGEDAVIKMYEITQVEPTLYETGDVDYYELNVINKAKEEDWLGERIDPTLGTPGIDVYGKEIEPREGHQIPLQFDPNTVISVEDERANKTVLRALRNGAVVYQGDTIMILNSIDIDGDVSVSTGNIDFDGFVEVSGTVDDNFSVIATDNIQILGDMGIGASSLIESRSGDVYIKGGIAGKNKAKIVAKKNIYTKFASDCVIECGGTVNIGYYAMNCEIRAKEVIFESDKSKIIGGETYADVKIIVGELGSRADIHTKVKVTGFDRASFEEDYNKLNSAIELTKAKLDTAKDVLDGYGKKVIKKSDYELYEQARKNHMKYKKRLAGLYEAQSNYISYLHAKGKGEVIAKKKVYPNVLIEICDDQTLVVEESNLQMHYYYLDDEIIIE